MTFRDQFLRMLAERAVDRLSIPSENRRAAVDNLVCCWEGVLSVAYRGETVELTTCKVPRETRAARNERILAALEAGESTVAVAAREGVSPRLVRWLRGKTAG